MAPQKDLWQQVKKSNVYWCAKDLCTEDKCFFLTWQWGAISEGQVDFGKQN